MSTTRMVEAISAFKDLLLKSDVDMAMNKYAEATGYEQQLELLESAKAGDTVAINYLYLKLIPQISRVFWSNYLGSNTSQQRRRINEGDQFVFAGMVYQVLLSAHLQNMSKEQAIQTMQSNAAELTSSDLSDNEDMYEDIMQTNSPLNTFDPSVFDEGTDLVDKFGYYLMGTLKSEAIVANRKTSRQGLTGNKRKNKDDVKVGSYEAQVQDNQSETAAGSFEDDTVDFDAFKSFAKDAQLDSGKEPTLRQTLKTALTQTDKFDVKAIAREYDATPTTVRNRLQSLPAILDEHGLDQTAFAGLINSGQDLAGQL